MKVSELIAELQKWPGDARVHLDVCAASEVKLPSEYDPTLGETSVSSVWEGDRVVRGVEGVRHQDGYFAVAIDAQSLADSEDQEDNFLIWDKPVVPKVT